MGKKVQKMNTGPTAVVNEPITMGQLEVISQESFQRRLQGMSSCIDCLKQRRSNRSKENCAPSQHHTRSTRKNRKSSHMRLNSPIVVRLQDTIKVSVKGKLKHSPKSSDQDSESGSEDGFLTNKKKETVSLNNMRLPCRSCRDDKNFNAFLSAIERVHQKGHGCGLSASWENLEEFVRSTKEKASYLNNSVNYHCSITHKDQSNLRRSLEFIERDNVDLICNDLSSRSSTLDSDTDNTDSSEVSERSESSSVISSTEECASDTEVSSICESICDGDTSLTRQELERLTEYTTGFPLRKYNYPPDECPECLAACYAYTSTYCSHDSEPTHTKSGYSTDSSTDSEPLRHEPPKFEVTVVSKNKVEVSVASLHKDARSRRRTCRVDTSNAVYVDLTGSDVSLTIQYHPDSVEHSSQLTAEWFYYLYNGYSFQPYAALPYCLMPIYYVPMPLFSMPKPLCVPRNLRCLNSQRLCMVPAHEVKNFTASQPPQRPWIPLAHPERSRPVGIYTVMCYNVLCDKYATRQLYGYCPSWALNWEYRKKGIIEEIRHYNADIITLQEVETDQFYNYFMPELKRDGYEGIFSPKSRARTMTESERKHVDGCAIFYRTTKFSLIKEHLIEFNQLAMSTAEGSHDMLNRVMTKDNIGLAALLETKDAVWENGIPSEPQARQPILVATCHVHWDPEFSDVKLIQTMMLMSELKNIIDESQTSLRPRGGQPDSNALPLLLCGDLNSLPESGVLEYLTSGRVSANHGDFKELGYEACLQKLSTTENKDIFNHNFKLACAYSKDIMLYTNYTFDFKGVIDYVFYSREWMRPLGVLGALDPEWFAENKVLGCPHPHVPSDHLPLLVEIELQPGGPSAPAPRPNPLHMAVRR